MRSSKALALTTAVIALVAPSSAAVALKASRLSAVHSFAFAIGSGDLSGSPASVAARYAPFGLVVIDGQEATRAEVRAIRRQGTIALGYLSVGAIEPFRPWYRRLKPFRLASKFKQFGEFYADLDAAGFRRAIAARIAPAILGKGFDGLFLDNTDMLETHPHQTPGMRMLVRALSRLVHKRSGGLLFSQNGQDVIRSMLRYYDGWNREDASWTYSFAKQRYQPVSESEHRAALAGLTAIRAAGLLTLSTDYTAQGDASAAAQSVAAACAVGALPFVSNIELTRIPAQPYSCP